MIFAVWPPRALEVAVSMEIFKWKWAQMQNIMNCDNDNGNLSAFHTRSQIWRTYINSVSLTIRENCFIRLDPYANYGRKYVREYASRVYDITKTFTWNDSVWMKISSEPMM